MSHAISNHNGSSYIDVDHYQNGERGPLVTVSQRLGSCSFLHQMTPIQAREMAVVLNDSAAAAEEAAKEASGVPA